MSKKKTHTEDPATNSTTSTSTTSTQATGTQTAHPEINIVSLYLKDVSFESPQTPQCFQSQTAPGLSFNLDTTHRQVGELYEVTLKVQVTAKEAPNDAARVLFLAEVQQAGLFRISGFPTQQLDHILGSYCPSVLFPYARQVIATLTGQGNFPSCQLPPVNFDSLYIAKQQAAAKRETETA